MQLLVLAKEPVAGKVKTRLCPPCTPAEAAMIAEASLADTLDAAVASGAERVLVALDGEPGPWLPAGVTVVPQGEGPFDRRLAQAWSHATGPALQIGMDTPQADAGLLARCLATLEVPDVDAALGVAPDGGWWAIGMRDPDPEVFIGVATSRPDTGLRQWQRLVAGRRAVSLPELRDVDSFADALAVAVDVPGSRFARCVDAVGGGVGAPVPGPAASER